MTGGMNLTRSGMNFEPGWMSSINIVFIGVASLQLNKFNMISRLFYVVTDVCTWVRANVRSVLCSYKWKPIFLLCGTLRTVIVLYSSNFMLFWMFALVRSMI